MPFFIVLAALTLAAVIPIKLRAVGFYEPVLGAFFLRVYIYGLTIITVRAFAVKGRLLIFLDGKQTKPKKKKQGKVAVKGVEKLMSEANIGLTVAAPIADDPMRTGLALGVLNAIGSLFRGVSVKAVPVVGGGTYRGEFRLVTCAARVLEKIKVEKKQ